VKLNLDHYSVNRKFVQQWYRDNSHEEVGMAISILACATHCPAIVVAHYIAEEFGYTPEIMETIDRLTQFYGYKEIKNQILTSPYLTSNNKGDIKE
jgi:hypothetical protein